MGNENIPFTKQMRKATRDVHDVSDALVNAKLAVALSDSSVWAEGLLIFYEIFRFLEEAMDRLKDTLVGELTFDGMRRTEAFEKDLKYYLGEDWAVTYTPRDSVMKYLLHLRQIETNDSDLLMAYIYHLYMGLLSGGQILRKKRMVVNRFFPFVVQKDGGNEVTDFGDESISKLKRQMTNAMNSIAERLNPEKKKQLIEESKMVFVRNNEIIRTVRGTNIVLLKKLIVASVIVALLGIFIIFVFKYL